MPGLRRIKAALQQPDHAHGQQHGVNQQHTPPPDAVSDADGTEERQTHGENPRGLGRNRAMAIMCRDQVSHATKAAPREVHGLVRGAEAGSLT